MIDCCTPDLGCIVVEDNAECRAANGVLNNTACGSPFSTCPDPAEQPVEGCYDGVPTWGPVGNKDYHTLDICEHTAAVPTFIEELDDTVRFEPVSTHRSRAQPVGHGQDPCQLNEGFLTINDRGDAEFLMCTGRGANALSYAPGYVVLSPGTEDAEIMFATEAPFPLELNLFSEAHLCSNPEE